MKDFIQNIDVDKLSRVNTSLEIAHRNVDGVNNECIDDICSQISNILLTQQIKHLVVVNINIIIKKQTKQISGGLVFNVKTLGKNIILPNEYIPKTHHKQLKTTLNVTAMNTNVH